MNGLSGENKDMLLDPEMNKNGGLSGPGRNTRVWAAGIQKATFSCEGLTVRTRTAPPYTILNSISTIFKPCTITALMGPSGSGKTTLLNVLSGRTNNSLEVDAVSLQLNGHMMTTADVKKFSSLVPQDDILMPVLTPRETITYAARLMMTKSRKEINALVVKTLEVLSLTECADTVCGDADLKGISGGERKRTSIGLELITNPSCIFLDEPTSGLDSKVALDVVIALRQLAEEGRTIVCTIHQPSYECFTNFDRILFLTRKGSVAFQGRTSELSAYFESIGKPCPQFKNIADHAMNVISAADFKTTFNDDNDFRKEFDEYMNENEPAEKLIVGEERDFNSRSELSKIPILFQRAVTLTLNDKKGFRTRMFQTIAMSLILGLTYLQLGTKQKQAFDRQSAMLLVVFFLVMTSIIGTINSIPVEKAMLKREYDNGMYSVTSFFLSRLVIYSSFQIIYATIYALLIYFLIGLTAELDKFFIFYAATLLNGFIAVVLGFFFGAIFPTVEQATIMVPLLLVPTMLFSGLLISFDSIPVYFLWLYYISFVQYIFKILLLNEFQDFEFDACSEKEFSIAGQCPLGRCAPPLAENETYFANKCPGELLLNSVDLQDLDITDCFLILIAYLVTVSIVCFFGVYFFLNPMKRAAKLKKKKN